MEIISNIIRFTLLYILVLFLELCLTCFVQGSILRFAIYDLGTIYLNLPDASEFSNIDGFIDEVPWVRFIEKCCVFGTPLIVILIGITVKRIVKFAYTAIKEIGKTKHINHK